VGLLRTDIHTYIHIHTKIHTQTNEDETQGHLQISLP